MAANGIHTGTLIAAVGGAGVLIEPCLYWPDVRNPLIEATVEKAHLDKLPVGSASPDGREAVHSIKQALVDLFFEYGAAHLQIGRAYRYADSLDPAAAALLGAVKAHLDPGSRMNSGVLGIS